MKKSILIILCCLFSFALYAQEKHMEFKGTPLNGSLTSFVQKMKTMGYTTVLTEDYGVVMEGEFIGKKANIFILPTPKTKIVWKVGVSLEKQISWSSLKSEYYKIKESYIKKYGQPKHTFESFDEPYYEGDGYELQALKLEKCTYESYFETPEGMIKVGMDSGGCITISYEDKINAEIKKMEQENAVMNEI